MLKKSSLKEDFVKRSVWFNNRASCVFPLFLTNEQDTQLVFQNYWVWKNNLTNVFCVLRIRDKGGNSILNTQIDIKEHNEISLSSLLNKDDIKFANKGTVEVEIITPDNLGYPFPAILAFYVTESQKSVVHSAGRILNSNEEIKDSTWKESNFSIELNNSFNPFICLFFGQSIEKRTTLKLKFNSYKNNKTLLKKSLEIDSLPFGSEIIYIKDFLNKEELKRLQKDKVFIIFEVKIKGIFGRFVVGNYHKKTKQHFTTHSFQFVDPKGQDSIEKVRSNESTSFLPLFNVKPLNAKIISFPTNQKKSIKLSVARSGVNERLHQTGEKINIKTGGVNSQVFEYSLTEDEFLKLETDDKVPARINVNYNFYTKKSLFPTDLATGFKARVYPPKNNHWGSGVLENKWKNIIFIRNTNHTNDSKSARCTFKAFTDKQEIKRNITINSESLGFIEVDKNEFNNCKELYFSWNLSSKEVSLEVFWVAYNEDTGGICAEHSF